MGQIEIFLVLNKQKDKKEKKKNRKGKNIEGYCGMEKFLKLLFFLLHISSANISYYIKDPYLSAS